MKCSYRNNTGFTLVELVAALAIILFFMSVAWNQLSPMTRRNEVLNNMRYVRAAFIRARATAIEYNQPVRFELDQDNRIGFLRDPTRDGNWSDAVVVHGGANLGESSPYTHVNRISIESINAKLPHWSLLPDLGNVAEFDSDEIFILPDGNVWAGLPLAPTGGTWFFQDDRDSFYGAVHVTAMGEVKMAFIRADQAKNPGTGAYNGWKWTD